MADFITVEIKTENLDRKFETLAEKSQDLSKPLRVFGGYLKKKSDERFAAQDFAPLAESTVKNRAQKGLRGLERKLLRDVKKAKERHKGALQNLLGAEVSIRGSMSKGMKSRLAVLAEFHSRHHKNSLKASLAKRADLPALTLKQALSLGAREDRAVARAVGKPILGRLRQMLKVEVGKGTVKLTDKTFEKFSEIHNAGGVAGHGAKIPKREFLKLDDKDMEVFAQILKDHHLAAFSDEDK